MKPAYRRAQFTAMLKPCAASVLGLREVTQIGDISFRPHRVPLLRQAKQYFADPYAPLATKRPSI